MQSDDDDELPSRSELSRQRKAEEERLAALATALVGLSARQRNKLALAEGLRDAVDEARRMTAHAARARQLRIVRRELRGSDSRAIAAAVDALVNPRGTPLPAVLAAQGWVDRFLGEGGEAVEAFVTEHPHADRQRLSALIRNARKAVAKRAVKARKTLVAAVQTWMQPAGGDASQPPD